MKKIFIIALFLIGIGFLSINTVYAYDLSGAQIETITIENNLEFKITDEKYYYYEGEDIVVFGNHDSLDRYEISRYISDGYKVFIYDFYLDDNLGYNVFDENSAVLYSNLDKRHVDILNLGELTFSDFKNEIINFYNEKNTLDVQNRTSMETGLFEPLYSGSFREVKKPYGYIDVLYTVKKYRAKHESSLYLVESKASFTPGKMARDNGDTTYSNWYNHSGFFHAEGTQAINEIDQATTRKGGIPKFKDAYPENSPGTITVTSSYSVGATLGYSFTNGFSLDNITVSQNTSLGLNISYGYSKSYTISEPALSTQRSSVNPNIYQWKYTYNTQRNETNHLNTGYLFEMNNYNHELSEDDLTLIYSYKMTVHDNGKWIFGKTQSFEGRKHIAYY